MALFSSEKFVPPLRLCLTTRFADDSGYVATNPSFEESIYEQPRDPSLAC